MKKFAVTFSHQGSAVTRIIEAPSRDYAMGCVCGFVYSCDEMPEHIAKLF